MRLRYSLYRLPIHNKPNAYKARLVVGNRVATIDEIAHMMVSQGSTVGYADIVAVLEELVVAMVNLLSLGFRIHLPFANFELTIRGVFEGVTDEFDPRRHEIYVNVTPGKRLRKDIRHKIQLSKDQQAPQTPHPTGYLDLESSADNHLVTPGGIARVSGCRLKFDLDDPQQGVFFVDQENRRAIRVESMIKIKMSELFFKVPMLPAGTYRVQVRAYVYNSPDVRSGELAKPLIVA